MRVATTTLGETLFKGLEMAKEIKLSYEKIEKRSKKAILVKFVGDEYKSSVWLPNFRIDLDEESKTVSMTQKLWDDVLPEAIMSFEEKKEKQKAKTKAYYNEILKLRDNCFDWEKGKMFGVKVDLANLHSDRIVSRGMIFLPKSLYKDGGVPRWIINKKVAEFIAGKGEKIVNILLNSGNSGFVIENFLAGEELFVEGDILIELGKVA